MLQDDPPLEPLLPDEFVWELLSVLSSSLGLLVEKFPDLVPLDDEFEEELLDSDSYFDGESVVLPLLFEEPLLPENDPDLVPLDELLELDFELELELDLEPELELLKLPDFVELLAFEAPVDLLEDLKEPLLDLAAA
ncbi:hypothetical protein [Clostridium intestinale]|uniref:hypothetical protein n=1 Tax=Clostridium intestinale TaxID=36845 RepID=UPI002DD6B908|nr:hypothetical protein [Clostridium intestinale]WRY49745.1 hypothetical protein P8F83_13530 [Clostridium intestinale]